MTPLDVVAYILFALKNHAEMPRIDRISRAHVLGGRDD